MSMRRAIPQTIDAKMIAKGPAKVNASSDLANSNPIKPVTLADEEDAPDVIPPAMPAIKFPSATAGIDKNQNIRLRRKSPIFPE